MLEKWLRVHNYSKRKFTAEANISRPTLDKILNKTAKDIHYKVALKIKAITGLNPWDYLKGYETLKKLALKK